MSPREGSRLGWGRRRAKWGASTSMPLPMPFLSPNVLPACLAAPGQPTHCSVESSLASKEPWEALFSHPRHCTPSSALASAPPRPGLLHRTQGGLGLQALHEQRDGGRGQHSRSQEARTLAQAHVTNQQPGPWSGGFPAPFSHWPCPAFRSKGLPGGPAPPPSHWGSRESVWEGPWARAGSVLRGHRTCAGPSPAAGPPAGRRGSAGAGSSASCA